MIDWRYECLSDMEDPEDSEVDFNYEELMNAPRNVYDLRSNKSELDGMSQQEMDDEIIQLNKRLTELANARIKKFGNKVK